jgi:hypothetical protein
MGIKAIIESKEFQDEIEGAFFAGIIPDYYFDGEEEVPYERYDETWARDAVIAVLKKFLLKEEV